MRWMRWTNGIVAAMVMLAGTLAFAQERVVNPPDTLAVQGVPKVPATLAETAGRYGAYRNAALVDWHPTSKQMLISTRFAETPQLHVVSMPGGERRQLTFFTDAVRNGRYHPKGGDYIVYAKDTGGGEWYQLYRYMVATGDITLLTDGKSRNLLGPWSSHGDRIAYMSTRRTGKDTDLWAMDPGDPKTDKLLTQLEGGGWEALDWSPDDAHILLKEEISINEAYLWLVDTKTGEKSSVFPQGTARGQKIAYGDAAFSKDGKGIYLTTDAGAEFLNLGYLDLKSLSLKMLLSGKAAEWDVQGMDLSEDGKSLAYVKNEDGFDSIHVLSTPTGKEVTLPAIPKGVAGGLRWHKNGKLLGFTLTNAQDPGDAYSVDLSTGKLEQWTHSESAVPTQDYPQAELVKWKSFDGKMIPGFLYRPPAKFTGKRPVLVIIHGGPEGQSQPIFLGRNNYLLNELGIALFYPNVRGSTGYGKTYSLLDNGFQREDTYKDINALFDWIAAQSGLDPARVAVMGGSYGGHMTLAVSTFYSDRIRCSVDIVGISNLVTFLEHTEAYRRDLRRVEYGDERDPKMRAYLEKIAPMNNIAMIKKPMLVIAGFNDPRVPVSESDQIVAALKTNGTPVWYLMARDEGHGFQKKANQDYQFYSTIEFLQEYLLK